MKDRAKKIKRLLKVGSLFSLVLIGIVVGTLFTFQINDVVVEQMGGTPSGSWRALGDGDPGGDVSGFMYAMTWQYNATHATDYAINLSNSSVYCYEYSDSLDTEMTGETPHSQKYVYLQKFRVNDTVGYNVTAGAWEDSWVRANITVTSDFNGGDTDADVAMTIVQIANNTDFAWYCAYILDANGGAGTGFELTHNEKFNITSITADGWY